jgi:hypothetical protein
MQTWIAGARQRADGLRATIDELKAGQGLMQDMRARELAQARAQAEAAEGAAEELRRARRGSEGEGPHTSRLGRLAEAVAAMDIIRTWAGVVALFTVPGVRRASCPALTASRRKDPGAGGAPACLGLWPGGAGV